MTKTSEKTMKKSFSFSPALFPAFFLETKRPTFAEKVSMSSKFV